MSAVLWVPLAASTVSSRIRWTEFVMSRQRGALRRGPAGAVGDVVRVARQVRQLGVELERERGAGRVVGRLVDRLARRQLLLGRVEAVERRLDAGQRHLRGHLVGDASDHLDHPESMPSSELNVSLIVLMTRAEA